MISCSNFSRFMRIMYSHFFFVAVSFLKFTCCDDFLLRLFIWSKNSFHSRHVNDARYTIFASFRSWDSRPLFPSFFLSFSLRMTVFHIVIFPQGRPRQGEFFQSESPSLSLSQVRKKVPLSRYVTRPLPYYIPAERMEHISVIQHYV